MSTQTDHRRAARRQAQAERRDAMRQADRATLTRDYWTAREAYLAAMLDR